MRNNPFANSHGLLGRCLLLLVVLFLASTVQAAETQLWGAVIVATNNRVTASVPTELVPYEKQIAKIFGYPGFQVLGQSTRSFSDSSEQWLIPGGSFSVKAVINPLEDTSYPVSLQLFQAKKELVQTEARLGPGSPLFIRGPLYGQGQLIIVIMVR